MTNAQRPSEMRRHNLSLVLDAIRLNPGISRAQLSNDIGLTRASITGLVTELLDREIIIENGIGHQGVGRPRIQLFPNPHRFMAIGIDARLDRIKTMAIDLTGKPIYSAVLPMPDHVTPVTLTHAIAKALRLVSGTVDRERIGVGLSLPSKAGPKVVTQPVWGWHNEPFGDILAASLGIDITIQDISEAASIANARQSGLIDAKRVLHVQVGAGSGIGLSIRGDLDPDAPAAWGRIGHIPTGDPERLCTCGRSGCLDASIGFDAFVDYCRGAAPKPAYGPARLNRFAAAIARSAKDGDAIAAHAIERVCEHLVKTLTLLSQIICPDAITLGGYPVFFGDDFFHTLSKRVSLQLREPSPLWLSPLGDDASTLGAAFVGLDAGLPRLAASGTSAQQS